MTGVWRRGPKIKRLMSTAPLLLFLRLLLCYPAFSEANHVVRIASSDEVEACGLGGKNGYFISRSPEGGQDGRGQTSLLGVSEKEGRSSWGSNDEYAGSSQQRSSELFSEADVEEDTKGKKDEQLLLLENDEELQADEEEKEGGSDSDSDFEGGARRRRRRRRRRMPASPTPAPTPAAPSPPRFPDGCLLFAGTAPAAEKALLPEIAKAVRQDILMVPEALFPGLSSSSSTDGGRGVGGNSEDEEEPGGSGSDSGGGRDFSAQPTLLAFRRKSICLEEVVERTVALPHVIVASMESCNMKNGDDDNVKGGRSSNDDYDYDYYNSPASSSGDDDEEAREDKQFG